MQVDRDGTNVDGFSHIPVNPHFETFRGEVLHTSQFPGLQKFSGLRVVVIGTENSSTDICQDLSLRGAASVTIVQRSKTCVVSSRETTKSFAQAYPGDRLVAISDFGRAAMPFEMARVMAQATMDQTQAVDKEMLEGLRKAGFQHYHVEDNSGPGILYLSQGGEYCKLDVGCAELIAWGRPRSGRAWNQSHSPKQVVFNDETELQANAVYIFATGYTSWRDRMKDIFDPEVVESTKEIWSPDEEGQMCGVYRPTGYPAVIPLANLAALPSY